MFINKSACFHEMFELGCSLVERSSIKYLPGGRGDTEQQHSEGRQPVQESIKCQLKAPQGPDEDPGVSRL